MKNYQLLNLRVIGTYRIGIVFFILIFSWNGLLKYTITVMLSKVLFHLLGCWLLNYFEWHSCIFMRVFSIFCPVQNSNERKYDSLKICLFTYFFFLFF